MFLVCLCVCVCVCVCVCLCRPKNEWLCLYQENRAISTVTTMYLDTNILLLTGENNSCYKLSYCSIFVCCYVLQVGQQPRLIGSRSRIPSCHYHMLSVFLISLDTSKCESVMDPQLAARMLGMQLCRRCTECTTRCNTDTQTELGCLNELYLVNYQKEMPAESTLTTSADFDDCNNNRSTCIRIAAIQRT